MNLYTDGGCTNNNQSDMKKRKMIIAVSDEDGTILLDKTKEGGSNNVAELWAIAECLALMQSCGQEEVTIHTDSQCAAAWVTKGRIGKHLNDRMTVIELLEAIRDLRFEVKTTIKWVPREHNLAGHYIERQYGL